MGEEKRILSHEPVRGYRRVFQIVICVAVIYLAVIFLISFI
jgi:hypothetical protein